MNWDSFTPTNGYAARRAYCYKHHRAKLDIGGRPQCVECAKESPKTNGQKREEERIVHTVATPPRDLR